MVVTAKRQVVVRMRAIMGRLWRRNSCPETALGSCPDSGAGK
jgi:hypothetical protein